ncbi:phosphatase PAP2 family protein [Methylobacillus rhizosphaerae]|nr:phosphatase PAP2 family protein [Methylobacillus rhizosphaerae]
MQNRLLTNYLQRICALDSALCIKVNRSSHYRLVRWSFRLVSRLGDGMFWYAIMLGIILTQGQAGILPCLHMITVGLIGTVLYKWLKGRTLRPRPYAVHQDIWLAGKPLDKFSFPSGHTLHAVAFSMVALHHYPELAPLIIPFAVLVAMSRVILGLHYPSDVIAGAILGALLATASFLIL